MKATLESSKDVHRLDREFSIQVAARNIKIHTFSLRNLLNFGKFGKCNFVQIKLDRTQEYRV